MSDVKRRIARLTEAQARTRKQGEAARPSYRQFATQEEYNEWAQTYRGPFVKCYVTVGPDSWPDPPKQGR